MGIIKRLTFSFFILIPVATIALCAMLLFLGLESSPIVNLKPELKQEDIGRINQFIKKNDPRRLRNGQVKKITIKQEELNLALGYTLITLSSSMGIGVDLNLDSAKVLGTIRVPKNPLGDFLNIKARVSFHDGKIKINQMALGSLFVPVFLVNPALNFGYYLFELSPWGKSVTDVFDSVQNIELLENKMTVEFQWNKDLAKRFQSQARDMMLSKSDRERIAFYSKEIAALSHSLKGSRLSLAEYLRPLFTAALERSQKGESPVLENRAMLFSLTLYAMGWSPEILTGNPDARDFPKAKKKPLTLLGRNDLSNHFLISAAIAAGSNSGLSSIVGVFKEMDDSREGSGFSFADLAADKAGIRFAGIATGQENQALDLQKAMVKISNESAFMPGIDHLPEGIMEFEFKKDYHDLNSMEYALVEQEIDQRISNCSVYSKVKNQG